MKKRIIVWIILWTSIIFLQGCMDIKLDIGKSIQAPKNKTIPIKGTWKIEKYKTQRDAEKEDLKDLLGKTAVFSERVAALGDEICEEPEYKVKNVNAKDYFLYTHKAVYNDLKFDSERIEVISVTSKDQYFYDFIRANDQRLMVYMDDGYYYLSKISDIINQERINKYLQNKEINKKEKKESNPLSAGVLIGLGDFNDENGEETYRTLWIAAENRKLYPIVEMKDLFVPRKSGFWIVRKNQVIQEGYRKDEIFAYPLEKNIIKEEIEEKKESSLYKEERLKENVVKQILFVGNDYIGTAYGKNIKNLSGIEMLLVDHVKEGMKISDLAGDEGKEAFFNSAKGTLSKLNEIQASKFYKPREKNFTLARRNGHWIMKGRLYNKKEKEKFLEFNIQMIPPYKIVHYDKLHVSWNEVKERVPKAQDIFTSPSMDIALVVTKEAIYVYEIKNNQLSYKYMKKIDLKEDERIVMAEWATGTYVDRWNDTIHSVESKK
ncbi:hypothetical protein [Crassaminicella profunda]|uniref:hypothetical protein n=1 Tax=Crassaminicella profunda TaxID=1286698 RepID=UPI001CA6790C|nr:hypothetical protein [Crassaminicella profunda]QZY57271.1 hypothetical protein K7H06_10275 [Crassaminicella profunda]